MSPWLLLPACFAGGLLLVWVGTALARLLTDDVAEEREWLARHLDEVAGDVADETWTEVREQWVDGGATIVRGGARVTYRPKYPWPGSEDYAFAAFTVDVAELELDEFELYFFPPYIDRAPPDDAHLPDWERSDLERPSQLEQAVGNGARIWTTTPERADRVVADDVAAEFEIFAEEHLKGVAISSDAPHPILLVVAGVSGPETLERYLEFADSLIERLDRS